MSISVTEFLYGKFKPKSEVHSIQAQTLEFWKANPEYLLPIGRFEDCCEQVAELLSKVLDINCQEQMQAIRDGLYACGDIELGNGSVYCNYYQAVSTYISALGPVLVRLFTPSSTMSETLIKDYVLRLKIKYSTLDNYIEWITQILWLKPDSSFTKQLNEIIKNFWCDEKSTLEEVKCEAKCHDEAKNQDYNNSLAKKNIKRTVPVKQAKPLERMIPISR